MCQSNNLLNELGGPSGWRSDVMRAWGGRGYATGPHGPPPPEVGTKIVKLHTAGRDSTERGWPTR